MKYNIIKIHKLQPTKFITLLLDYLISPIEDLTGYRGSLIIILN